MTHCLYGADKPPRCEQPAADGFDYCEHHGRVLGAFFIEMPWEREKMKMEHEARVAAAEESR